MVALPLPVAAQRRPGRPLARLATPGLLVLLIAVSVISVGTGAAGLSLSQIASDLVSGAGLSQRDHVILFDIRLPRLMIGLLVGAGLAVSGALMQGLFRNPLADPGIVGVGAGSGLGAVLAIVLGGLLPAGLLSAVGAQLIPVAAFAGGWVTVILLYRVATQGGRTSVPTMLLAGIAVGAFSGAITGMLVYIANDQQLRDLTFWGLGSLAGASWSKVGSGVVFILPVLLLAPFLGRGLNALALGEAQAAHMGVQVQLVKRLAILAVAASAGASVAVAGGIGFIGIVVPHLLRLLTGPDHRLLLPNAALLGATLLVLADMLARTLVAPAEMPIGIVTATIGAPVFLWILLRRRGIAGF